MGNKQKNIKNNFQKNKKLNQKAYLLCPNCFKKVPLLNTFIDKDILNVKLSCSCIGENTFIIMTLLDYLSAINNRTNSNFFFFFTEIFADNFCMNCENWLCNKCFDIHSKDICEKEYHKNNNKQKETLFCKIHYEKKVYLCQKCILFFCKKCFIHHNSKNTIKHKGANIEYYLTEDKIKAKYNRFQTYMNNIIELTNVLKNELLKDINLSEKETNKVNLNKDHDNAKINFQDNYLIHKSINEELKFLIEAILNNCEYFQTEKIINYKFICDVIINTKINKSYPRLDRTLPIITQMKYFSNFLKSNYINKKQNYEFNLIHKNENSNSIIEKMLSLPDNKFVTVNKDCEIIIWKINNIKNIPAKELYIFHEHTNNITCIILSRNKNYFATASDDSTIKIWDFNIGRCTKTIIAKGKPFAIYEIYGKKNQIGCVPNRNSIAIYEYDEQNQNIIFNIPFENNISWIESLYSFPNDGRILLSSYGKFEIFSDDFQKIKDIYIANNIPQFFLQIKNEDLIVCISSPQIFIYDMNFNFKRKLYGHKSNITSVLEISNNKLLTSSLDSNIILWGIDSYEMISRFINNQFGINYMISINENYIITCSFLKTNIIIKWEIKENENYEEIENKIDK